MSAGLGRAFSVAVFATIVALAVWAWVDPGPTSRAPLRLGVMLGETTVPDLGELRPLVAASRLAGGPVLEILPATLAELRQAPEQWAAALVGDRSRFELERSGWRAVAALADSADVGHEMGILVAAPAAPKDLRALFTARGGLRASFADTLSQTWYPQACRALRACGWRPDSVPRAPGADGALLDVLEGRSDVAAVPLGSLGRLEQRAGVRMVRLLHLPALVSPAVLLAAPGRSAAVERLLAGLRALPSGDSGASRALAGLQFLALQTSDPATARP